MSERLAGVQLLASLPEEELHLQEQRCRWRRYHPGDVIFDQASTSRELFFVIEGEVQVVSYALSGHEVVYAVIEAGDHFGELRRSTASPRSASVVAPGRRGAAGWAAH